MERDGGTIYLAIKYKPSGYVGQTMCNMQETTALHMFQDIEECREFIENKCPRGCQLLIFDAYGEHGPTPVRHHGC